MAEEEKTLTIKKDTLWKISTFLLLAVLIVFVIISFSGSWITGKTISEEEAGEGLVSYLSSVGYDGFEVLETKDLGTMYEIITIYQENEVPFYITKDGYIIGNSLTSILPEEESTGTGTQEIPKSDRPVVELFIWGYCPYGVQAQGPMAEVAKLLGDYADFKAVLYYGGHGDFEIQQNKIQECIQELYPEKYWDYASGFVKDIYPVCSSSRTVDCDKTESVKLMKSLGIDSSLVLDCVETRGEELISEASSRAYEADVSGSPTILINGVKANIARNEESIKSAVCDAFTDAPEECATTLSSDTTASQGNC